MKVTHSTALYSNQFSHISTTYLPSTGQAAIYRNTESKPTGSRTHRTRRLQEDCDLLVFQHELQEETADEPRDVPRDGDAAALGG